MTTIGKVLSRHRNNSMLSIIVALLGLMFAGCALFLLAVRSQAAPAAQGMLLTVIAGGLIIGVGLIVLGIFMRRGGWEVGEQGVRRLPESAEGTFSYGEIAETFQFYRHGASVQFGWRRRSQHQWHGANAHVSGYRRFVDGVLDGYMSARVPVMVENLRNGGSETFRMVGLKGTAQRAFAVTLNALGNIATEPLTISSRHLSYGNTTINLAEVLDVDYSDWTSCLYFRLRDGKEVSLQYTALFDGPLLVELLGRMRN